MSDRDTNCSNPDEDSDTKFIFDDYTGAESFEQCWKCWDFPPIKFENQVKILNPKYCWLYPKRTNKKLKELIPNFDDCKTLYTRCDFQLEACVHEQFLKLETDFKAYDKKLRRELHFQIGLIDKIWTQSVRYCLLTESSACVKYYPEIVSGPTEKRALCEFQTLLKKLHSSNCRLRDMLNQIQADMDELDRRCNHLDMTLESPFVLGDGGQQRSLAYIREIITDIFTYFYNVFCQMRSWAQLIDPLDTAAIEDYKAILESAHDFSGFMIIGVPTCSCRSSKFIDCIKHHKPC